VSIKRVKKCSRCGKLKSISDFHQRKAAKDGHTAACSDCINEKNREEYARNEDMRARKIAQVVENRRKHGLHDSEKRAPAGGTGTGV
jgi:hypothetical protein